MKNLPRLAFLLLALTSACGDDAESDPGTGGGGSGAGGSASATTAATAATTAATASTSTTSGAGGAVEAGELRLATPFVDLAGTVPLRVLRVAEDGSMVDVSDEAEVTSLDGELLEVSGGRATGLATGGARVEVAHQGDVIEGEIRVRGWSRVDFLDLLAVTVGYDGTVLGSDGDGVALLEPGATSWTSLGAIDAFGAAPLAGGGFFLPRSRRTLDASGAVGPSLDFPFTPTGGLAHAFAGGRCVLVEDGSRYFRWCDGVASPAFDFPSGGDAPDSVAVDDAGRVAFLDVDARVHVETTEGAFTTFETGGSAFGFGRHIAFAADGTGWATWVSEAGTVQAASFSADALGEIIDLDVTPDDLDLAVLPDGTCAIGTSDGDALGVRLLPDGPSLDLDGGSFDLFGGKGGQLRAYHHDRRVAGSTEDVYSTDGSEWAVEDRLACERTSTSTHVEDDSYAYAVECDAERYVDVFR